tara:strand:+ start:967 stop:1245 length:279 start_codon:yes stop_codon:yes gene_type:complete
MPAHSAALERLAFTEKLVQAPVLSLKAVAFMRRTTRNLHLQREVLQVRSPRLTRALQVVVGSPHAVQRIIKAADIFILKNVHRALLAFKKGF